jgi:hypothetical protein
MEQQNLGGTRHFEDIIYQQIISQFNYFTDGEMDITSKTRVENIIICFLYTPGVIALCISYIPMF